MNRFVYMRVTDQESGIRTHHGIDIMTFHFSFSVFQCYLDGSLSHMAFIQIRSASKIDILSHVSGIGIEL